ncbi:FAD:protein FMN transferase [Saccharospirillum salsuginis]|nr:FAD:protein FMN transferase [Saccharospirillum salsuginis]
MGGPCVLSVYTDCESGLMDRLEAEVRRLETKYSRFDPDSLLSRMNRSAGDWFDIDPETAGLLDFADQCFRESEGLFDITTGVLRRAWDFKSGRLPEQRHLNAVLSAVGWPRVERRGSRIKIPTGMELDLGGLVKEFAADRLLALMAEADVSGLVNLAGDIGVTGPQPDGTPWLVGISHPRRPGQAAATLPLSSGALATSGDYERFMVVNGRRYCHILHPGTGWPVPGGPASVTIVTDHCLLAGALTTMAMLKGKEAESWLAGLGVPFLLFDEQLTVSGTLASRSPRPHSQ